MTGACISLLVVAGCSWGNSPPRLSAYEAHKARLLNDDATVVAEGAGNKVVRLYETLRHNPGQMSLIYAGDDHDGVTFTPLHHGRPVLGTFGEPDGGGGGSVALEDVVTDAVRVSSVVGHHQWAVLLYSPTPGQD